MLVSRLITFGLFVIENWCHATGSSGNMIGLGILPAALTPHLVAKFSLFVATLLVWVLLCGKLGERFLKLPTIASQIIAGIALGPSLIHIAGWSLFSDILGLADSAGGSTHLLASSDLFITVIVLISSAWTVSYLLWIAGHETDVKDIYQIGFVAVVAGFLGALFPIVLTTGVMHGWGVVGWTISQMIGLGLAFAATSVSIPVAMLVASDKMHLKSSKATLGAAIIDDILAVIFLSLYFIALQSGFLGAGCTHVEGAHCVSLSGSLLYMAGAFVCIGIVGIWIKPVLLRWLQTHKATHFIAPIAQVSMQLHFAFAELFGGIAGITGAYFSGLFHKQGDPTHSAQEVFSPYVHAVLLPLFLGSIGLQIDVSVLSGADWLLVLVLLALAILSKLAGCAVATALSNTGMNRGASSWTALETYLFGSSMVARGEVGLVIASVLYSAKILITHQYVIAIVVIVLSTVAAPIMLAVGFARTQGAQADDDVSVYTVALGKFPLIGTERMFDLIVGRLQADGRAKTVIEIGQGRRIVNSEGSHIDIMIDPDQGITCRGDRATIVGMIEVIRRGLAADLASMQGRR